MSDRKTKRESGAFYKKKRAKKAEELQVQKAALEKFLGSHKNQESCSNVPMAADDSITVDFPVDQSEIENKLPDAILPSHEKEKEANDKVDTDVDFDPAKWPKVLSNQIKQIIVEKGPIDIPNNFSYPVDENERHFSSKHFQLVLSNRERIKRTWLVYSVSEDKIYCFCCKLFSSLSTKFVTGYNDWKNLSYAINNHEKNFFHLRSFNDWSELLKRKRLNKTINAEYERLLQNEKQHWRDVFERVTQIILTMAELNLPFRGSSDAIYENNNGVFLKFVECFGLYDPVIKEHLRRITSKKTNVHYLSKDIQNELIELLAQKTKNKIIEMAKNAEFFSVIMDTTPDISHKEQLTLIIRFVNTNSNSAHLVEEHFIGFLEIDDTSGYGLASKFLAELKNLGLDIKNCRGQGYDNGANMRGKNIGLQRQILNINSRAFFVPCSCHSLNLVLNDAAESNIEMVNFFGTVQAIYNFFSASTHRWSELLKHISSLTLKPVCSTRWESRINAIRPIRYQIGEIYDALIDIMEDPSLMGSHGNKTKIDAKNLAQKLKNYQFICTAVLWYNVLLEVNRVNLLMQNPTFSICAAVETIESVFNNLKKFRTDEEFQNLFITAHELAEMIDLEPKFEEIRIKKRKRNFEYEATDEPMEDSTQKFKLVYFNLLDVAINSIEERFQQLSYYKNTFGFLHSISKLTTWKKEDILKYCKDLEIILSDDNKKDIDGIQLSEELIFISSLLKPSDDPNDVLKYILQNELLPIYPNLYIALKILLTMPVSVASGERSFSRLKLIKNYLRSSMSQNRLSGLSILSIESDISRAIDKEDILRDFANIKARRKF